MKKCNHKWTMAWQEIKGKTFPFSRNCEMCVKCKVYKITNFSPEEYEIKDIKINYETR